MRGSHHGRFGVDPVPGDAATWLDGNGPGRDASDQARWDQAFATVHAPDWPLPLAAGTCCKFSRRRWISRQRWRWLERGWTVSAAAAVVALLAVLAEERPPASDSAPILGLAFVPEAPPPKVVPLGVLPVEVLSADVVPGSAPVRGLGAFADRGPYARIAAGAGEASLFVALARLAAQTDGLAVMRLAPRPPLATRLGPAAAAEAIVADATGRTRACTGFHVRGPGSAGLLCPGAGAPSEAVALLGEVGLGREPPAEAGPMRELGGNREARRTSTSRVRRTAAGRG